MTKLKLVLILIFLTAFLKIDSVASEESKWKTTLGFTSGRNFLPNATGEGNSLYFRRTHKKTGFGWQLDIGMYKSYLVYDKTFEYSNGYYDIGHYEHDAIYPLLVSGGYTYNSKIFQLNLGCGLALGYCTYKSLVAMYYDTGVFRNSHPWEFQGASFAFFPKFGVLLNIKESFQLGLDGKYLMAIHPGASGLFLSVSINYTWK